MLGVINGLAQIGTKSGTPYSPTKMEIHAENAAGKLEKVDFDSDYLLNPTNLKVSRKVEWEPVSASDSDGAAGAPYFVFKKGTDTLTFTLIFDASEKKDIDLRSEMEKLYDLTYPYIPNKGQKSKRAKLVSIEWNNFNFTGVLESVDVDVSLFDPKGAWKRATVAISATGYAFDSKSPVVADFFEKPRDKKPAN